MRLRVKSASLAGEYVLMFSVSEYPASVVRVLSGFKGFMPQELRQIIIIWDAWLRISALQVYVSEIELQQ